MGSTLRDEESGICSTIQPLVDLVIFSQAGCRESASSLDVGDCLRWKSLFPRMRALAIPAVGCDATMLLSRLSLINP